MKTEKLTEIPFCNSCDMEKIDGVVGIWVGYQGINILEGLEISDLIKNLQYALTIGWGK
jgi:hypothetical protein